jgi:hypothetical protein
MSCDLTGGVLKGTFSFRSIQHDLVYRDQMIYAAFDSVSHAFSGIKHLDDVAAFIGEMNHYRTGFCQKSRNLGVNDSFSRYHDSKAL